MKPHEYIQIVISEKPTGRLAWAQTRFDNATSFGWLKEFQCVAQHRAENSPNGTVQLARKATSNGAGGRRIVLGRGSNYHRPGAGNRRQFKVSTTCSNFDLAELFHFTEGGWDWMTTKAGLYWTACEWEACYRAAKF